MKIALVSGFLNDHLLPFCEELNINCEFHFIATQDLSMQGTQYKKTIDRDYVLHYYKPAEHNKSISEVLESDIVIFGGSSSELLNIRKTTKKLSFIYTERFFKKGTWRRFIPSTRKILNNQFIKNNENLYILCSGSFVSNDLEIIGFDTEKCFKFGYFPQTDKIPLETLISKKQSSIPKFLYVGKLLKLKRVIDILKCCERLQKKGIAFELNIVGDGPEKNSLEAYAKNHNLHSVYFRGSQSKDKTFEFMQNSNLCFVSSDRHEGWAAVINESLSQACPVIASNTCGATAYLIKNGINGYCYNVGNIKDLYSKVLQFLNNTNKEKLYKNAFNTIADEWNATVATKRFLEISRSILENKNTALYQNGPLSKC